MVVILMGVAGCGKTTVGRSLAERLGWPLLDADEFHSAQSIEKMRAGIPLADADRWPWLDRMNAALHERSARGESVLLACSALKQSYRDRLGIELKQLRWIYLKGDFALIHARLQARKGHYMKAGLLESQFAALEEPLDALTMGIEDTPQAIAEQILQQLQSAPLRKAASSL